jgi:hypothetical protein
MHSQGLEIQEFASKKNLLDGKTARLIELVLSKMVPCK